MAISDSEKLDRLWKRDFGVAKTASGADKAASNETIPSPLVVLPSSVWKEADLIPATAPASTEGVVEIYAGGSAIRATSDPTSSPNVAWLATDTFGDVATRLGGFIPASFGSSYAVKVWVGDPAAGGVRIFPDASNQEWVFDYTAGVLIFPNNIPSGVAANGIYIEAARYIGATGVGGDVPNAFGILLGDVSSYGDGTFDGGAVPLTPDTSAGEAIDALNEVLGKLVPAQPPAFPNATALTIANAAGSSPRLASGVTDNSGTSTLAAGDAVTRITAASINSNTFGDMGPGDAGAVSVLLNGSAVPGGARTLSGTGDNGTYAGLVIADQKDYPVAQPGFWKSVDISLSGLAVPAGVSKVRIAHSAAGQTAETYFVRDALTATPAISAGSVTEKTQGVLAYSSGIPHYNTGAVLSVGLSISNLAGETYYGGVNPVTISATNGLISSDDFTYAQLGISTPIARQTTVATPITAVDVAIDGTNVHHSGVIQAVARNVNGAPAAATVEAKTVLVKRGTANGRMDESSVTVSGLGSTPNADNAVRVGTASGDTPAGAPAAWVSANPKASHEASVVGGVLKHDQSNYGSNLPAGPDYSTHDAVQYATFSFKRAARSAFKIAITGTYAGVYVKLPGVEASAPNAPNGWWNAFKPYDGAGVPGEAGDTDAGCALGTVMSGASGTFQITFGTQSSTNATGNEILVRIKLTAGQQVTALSFTN